MAPFAVIRTTPVRAAAARLASNVHDIVPVFVPLAPDVIRSHPPLEVTAAVQGMFPDPALETVNVVVPAVFVTGRLAGETAS